MNKIELTERIIDKLTDPWTDSMEDWASADMLTISEAENVIDSIREEDNLAELEKDERLPMEVTPELVQEAWNCYVRSARHEMTIRLMAEYLTDTESVCEYDQYYTDSVPNAVRVLPVTFIEEQFPFPLEHGNEPTAYELIIIGQNSVVTFHPERDEYCWFDQNKWQLFSSDAPFHDGVINAEAVARYMIDENPDFLNYMRECIMDEDDIKKVFKYAKED